MDSLDDFSDEIKKRFEQEYSAILSSIQSYMSSLEQAAATNDETLVELIRRLQELGEDTKDEEIEYGTERLSSIIELISKGIPGPAPRWKDEKPSSIEDVVDALHSLPVPLILDLLDNLGTTQIVKEKLKDAVLANSVEDFKHILYENHVDTTRLSKVIQSFHVEGVDPADIILPYLREGRMGPCPKRNLDAFTNYLEKNRDWLAPREKTTVINVVNNYYFPEDYRKRISETLTSSDASTNGKETAPTIKKEPEGDGVPEMSFTLPRDEKWNDCGFYNKSEDKYYIQTTLGAARMVRQEQIEALFKTLVETGCVENKEDVLLALAVRLTGRKLMTEPIPEIEWIGEDPELDYLIFRLTPVEQKPEYSRYKHFFKDYNPNGAGRRVATGKVRETVINGLNEIMLKKDRPNC